MMKPTKAVILCAGFGTRLQELSDIRPKPLMELVTYPLVHHLIKILESLGVKNIFINTHYKSDILQENIIKLKTRCTIKVVKEERILGTGGGLINVLNHFNIDNSSLLVLHGDILSGANLKKFITQSSGLVNLLCEKKYSAEGYEGSIGADDNGRITELGKYYKSKGEIKNKGFFTGVHLLNPQGVALLKKETGHCLVSEIYPKWLREGRKVKAHFQSFAYADLGTKERLLNTNLALFKNGLSFSNNLLNEFEKKNGVWRRGKIGLIDENCLIPPVVLSNGCTIKAGSKIGPNCIIGDYVTINKGVRIKDSVIMSGTTIKENETLENTIALQGVRVKV